MLRIRLQRKGRRNLPMYNIVVAEQKFRNAGRFVEKIGYYQPTLKNDDPFRFKINADSYKKWVNLGAQSSDKIKSLASKLDLEKTPEFNKDAKKTKPKKKAQERMVKKTKE